MYERSYMHRENVTHMVVTATHFLITASKDGFVKFWKKIAGGIEFVKQFKAHLASISSISVSQDGFLLATAAGDQMVKIFDVVNFDMIHMIRLDFNPSVLAWIQPSKSSKGLLAVGSQEDGSIHIFKSDGLTPIASFKVHSAPVHLLAYNEKYQAVISGDLKGNLEYWSAEDFKSPVKSVAFKYKLDTDLYAFIKAKTRPTCLQISHDGELFATMAEDKHIRVFRFRTGKLVKEIDEGAQLYENMQKADNPVYKLDMIDFGRRMAVERDLDKVTAGRAASIGAVPASNVLFDESDNYIIYPTLLGIKVVCLQTNRLVRVLGKVENTERFLGVVLFQGTPINVGESAAAAQGAGLIAADANAIKGKEEDPCIFALAFNKPRFYWFSKREPEEPDAGNPSAVGRDIFNEKPSKDVARLMALPAAHKMGKQATLHTTMGDITVELYPEECPKTVENFTTHARNGYYNNVVFHRVIKDFMVQTGDPEGNGTGGESIWGGEFEDEFHRKLRHDRPGTLSMANMERPHTNGSQFFITCLPTPWLDNKHTVFGRVVKGMDVVHSIEKVKVDSRSHRPFNPIKIINIEIVK